MKKRKKQKKQYRYRRNIVEKCVKLETVPANEDTFAVLDALFESYRQCKNMFLERLSLTVSGLAWNTNLALTTYANNTASTIEVKFAMLIPIPARRSR